MVPYVRKAIRQEKLKNEYKRHEFNPLKTIRDTHRQILKDSRYTIIAQKRDLNFHQLDPVSLSCSSTSCSNDVPAAKLLSDTASKCDSPSTTEKEYCLYDIELEDLAPKLAGSMESHNSLPLVKKDSASDVITCNGQALIREQLPNSADSHQYVFDIYYINQPRINFRDLESCLSIQAYQEEMSYR